MNKDNSVTSDHNVPRRIHPFLLLFEGVLYEATIEGELAEVDRESRYQSRTRTYAFQSLLRQIYYQIPIDVECFPSVAKALPKNVNSM